MKQVLFAGLVLSATVGCGASPAFEPDEVTIEHRTDVSWTPAPDDFSTPFALGQTWVGSYTCAQGETALALHIVDLEGAKLGAMFEFEHAESDARGMFEMRGAFTVDRRSVTLLPVRWIRQPENYVMVGMRGTVSVGGKRFLGMVDGPGCTTFSLRLVR